MSPIAFLCPETRSPLQPTPDGLRRTDGALYAFLPNVNGLAHAIPNFLDPLAMGEGQRVSLAMYATEDARAIYRNFLDWLFATFEEPEAPWRQAMVARLRLQPGDAVLVTGCGLGDDLGPILDAIGPGGELHAQDLSPQMVHAAATHWAAHDPARVGQIRFSVGNALHLPFADGAFNAAFHFGGINLFDDPGAGIREMARATRPGGRVVVGDEGVAPWLRETDYGRMVIANIPLWGRAAPIEQLPAGAREVSLDWVLGQCFWVIGFTLGEGLPFINPHIPHQGRRGGTMWTRHMGQLEGVSPALRDAARQAAATAGLSLHDWLEAALREKLAQPASSTASPKPERP